MRQIAVRCACQASEASSSARGSPQRWLHRCRCGALETMQEFPGRQHGLAASSGVWSERCQQLRHELPAPIKRHQEAIAPARLGPPFS